MKIFIDVGSNTGQTVSAIYENAYGFDQTFCSYEFDRIYSFEPAADLHRRLMDTFRDPRITFYPFGLWNKNCEMPLFSPGSQAGSIFADKRNIDTGRSVMSRFVRASEWFREHVSDADEVYVKLNCEGCEADIIDDLLDSNEYRKITSLAVTFDVRKIPSQRHREDEIKRRLKECGYVNYVDLNTLTEGARRPEYIRRWLSIAGADRRSLPHEIRRRAYGTRIFLARVARHARRRLKGR